MDELALIRMCKRGQREHYKELIEHYEETLYKYCYHLTGDTDESQELFQNTWLKVIEKIHMFSEEHKFKNWLLSIATNTFKDSYRKKKRRRSIFTKFFIRENDKDDKSPESLYMENDEKNKLREVVSGLKEHYRVVVILFYFNEKSIKDIAYILSIPEGTVKSRLNQSKRIIKTRLEKEGIGIESEKRLYQH